MVSTLAGTATMVRLVLRRDRVRIPVWLAAIVGLAVLTAASIRSVYPTPADLRAAAILFESNPTALALNGPAQGLDTLGGRVAFEVGAFGFVVVALLSLLMVTRHTRAEEESGRIELLRAAVLGRHAATTAALLVAAGTDVLVGAAVAAGMIALGLPVTGSIVFGAALAAVGMVFAGVAAVAAQVTEHTRAASGIALAVLGLGYALRAAGDVGDGTLSWLSPIGWGQAARAFAGERWWPLLLALAVAALLAAASLALGERRDLGAGLVPPRPGPAAASRGLSRPMGLALRLQRGSLLAWAVGLFLLGAAYGSLGQDIDDFVADSPELAEFLATAGGASLTDSFFATALLVVALIGSGYAISAALRPRGEETAGRAEAVLAAPVPRWRWAGSHLAVAAAGSVAVLAAGGLGAGVAYGATTGDAGEVARLLGAALVHVPAVWVLVGLAVALFGLAPRAATLAWAALAGCVLVGLLGPLLKLPAWVSELSPFRHVPQVPAAHLALGPLAVLVAVAAALAAAGLAGFRRRDVGAG